MLMSRFGIIPFTVTATKRNASGAGTPTPLTHAQLASLRQPILVTGTGVTTVVCSTRYYHQYRSDYPASNITTLTK